MRLNYLICWEVKWNKFERFLRQSYRYSAGTHIAHSLATEMAWYNEKIYWNNRVNLRMLYFMVRLFEYVHQFFFLYIPNCRLPLLCEWMHISRCLRLPWRMLPYRTNTYDLDTSKGLSVFLNSICIYHLLLEI